MLYKPCFFDLYGTLVDIHTDESTPLLWNTMSHWYTSHGVPYTPASLHTAYLQQVQAETDAAGRRLAEQGITVQYPEPDLGRVFRALFKDTGADDALLKETAQLFRRSSRTRLRLYAGAQDLLKSLKHSGSRVCLLTNAQRLFTEQELQDTGIHDLFDGIFISSDYGVKKPDPVFFEMVLQNTGYHPSECLMIGNDLSCDILGAQYAGMPGYYIHSNLSPSEDRGKAVPSGCMYQKGMNLKLVQKRIAG